jgi:restriction system protein
MNQNNRNENIEELKKRADSLFENNDFDGALHFLKMILQINPENVEILTKKGLCLTRKKQYITAIEYFKRALDLDRTYASAWKNYAYCCYLMDNFEGAEQFINAAIYFGDKCVETRELKAVLLAKRGDFRNALFSIDYCLDFEPDNSEYLSIKAGILTYFGKYIEALEIIKKSLDLNPNDSNSWNTKSVILFSLKHYEDAIKAADIALKIDPQNSIALKSRDDSIYKLERVKNYCIEDINLMNGYDFEKFLLLLFTSLNYVVEHTPLSGDQGADLVILKNGIKTVVQAKNQKAKVGNRAIQEVVASIKYYDASNAIVVTNSEFTASANELARINNVELWDRTKLTEMLDTTPIRK